VKFAPYAPIVSGRAGSRPTTDGSGAGVARGQARGGAGVHAYTRGRVAKVAKVAKVALFSESGKSPKSESRPRVGNAKGARVA
jgi:hypothetical protein